MKRERKKKERKKERKKGTKNRKSEGEDKVYKQE
jgi:hypothetical protein